MIATATSLGESNDRKAAYAGIVTWVILKAIDVTVGLRVHVLDEREGLDVTLHGEEGYANAGGSSMGQHHEDETSGEKEAPAMLLPKASRALG